MKHLGARLKAARNAAGLTQQTLAERARTATTVVSMIETGRPRGDSGRAYEPGLDLAKRLADALGVSVDYLVSDEPLETTVAPAIEHVAHGADDLAARKPTEAA